MSRKFLNIHVLIAISGANPNRDDTGTPKSLRYGGVERSRMSSQALTRAKRLGYEADPEGERSYRSALLGERICAVAEQLLSDSGASVDAKTRAKIASQAVRAVNALVMNETKAEKRAESAAASIERAAAEAAAPADTDPDSESGDTLVWLAEAEVNAAALKIAGAIDGKLLPEDFVVAGRTSSLSIAAFGRMFAQRPDLQNEAAIQRAHAFTTHAASIDLDYFTAMDDLRTADRGAGHIGLKQNTGGVYYWHANIDRDQLHSVWDISDVHDPRARLTALARHLLHDLPKGSQNVAAHHTLPVYAMLVEADAPVSLQAAFEQPILPGIDGGYIDGSVAALVAEHSRNTTYAPGIFGSGLATGTHATRGDSAAVDFTTASGALASWALGNGLTW
jgi:CRISPR system Cascade subunit CasC